MKLLAWVLVVGLAGCASGYQRHYKPSGDAESIARIRVAPPTGRPVVERRAPAEPDVVMDAYTKRGYMVVGHAIFDSGRVESEDAALQQAITVGADLVLIFNPQYKTSITTHMPVTTPITTTTRSKGTATVTGPQGTPVTAQVRVKSTTEESTTTYVPVTTHFTDYGAVYMVKVRSRLGVLTRDLNDAERQKLQTNRGAAVRLIVDGSPAFEADVLPGDIVARIDDAPITNAQGFNAMLGERTGTSVRLQLIRGERRIDKVVQLGR